MMVEILFNEHYQLRDVEWIFTGNENLPSFICNPYAMLLYLILTNILTKVGDEVTYHYYVSRSVLYGTK